MEDPAPSIFSLTGRLTLDEYDPPGGPDRMDLDDDVVPLPGTPELSAVRVDSPIVDVLRQNPGKVPDPKDIPVFGRGSHFVIDTELAEKCKEVYKNKSESYVRNGIGYYTEHSTGKLPDLYKDPSPAYKDSTRDPTQDNAGLVKRLQEDTKIVKMLGSRRYGTKAIRQCVNFPTAVDLLKSYHAEYHINDFDAYYLIDRRIQLEIFQSMSIDDIQDDASNYHNAKYGSPGIPKQSIDDPSTEDKGGRRDDTQDNLGLFERLMNDLNLNKYGVRRRGNRTDKCVDTYEDAIVFLSHSNREEHINDLGAFYRTDGRIQLEIFQGAGLDDSPDSASRYNAKYAQPAIPKQSVDDTRFDNDASGGNSKFEWPRHPSPRPHIQGHSEYANNTSPERRKWAMDWQKYCRRFFGALNTKFPGVHIIHDKAVVNLPPSSDILRQLSLHAGEFGINPADQFPRESFSVPAWWIVCLDEAHQAASKLHGPPFVRKVRIRDEDIQFIPKPQNGVFHMGGDVAVQEHMGTYTYRSKASIPPSPLLKPDVEEAFNQGRFRPKDMQYDTAAVQHNNGILTYLPRPQTQRPSKVFVSRTYHTSELYDDAYMSHEIHSNPQIQQRGRLEQMRRATQDNEKFDAVFELNNAAAKAPVPFLKPEIEKLIKDEQAQIMNTIETEIEKKRLEMENEKIRLEIQQRWDAEIRRLQQAERERERIELIRRQEEEQRKIEEQQIRMLAEIQRRTTLIAEGFAPTDVCTVCLDAYPNLLFETCKHQCVCAECNLQINRCPLCRTPSYKANHLVVPKEIIDKREQDRAEALRHATVKEILAETRIEAEVECVICMDGDCNTIIRPCNHRALCSDCTEHLAVCPMCRGPVEDVLIVKEKDIFVTNP